MLMETLHCSDPVVLSGCRKQQSIRKRQEEFIGAFISAGSLGATKVFLIPIPNFVLSHAILLGALSHQR